jgi:nucleoside-diphosphate-sugar epimerase
MILVTGGTGFIGRNLIKALTASGRPVRILLKPSKNSPDIPKGISIEVAVSSLTDQRGMRAAMKNVDLVIHLASAERAGIKGDLNQVDVEGTISIVKAAKESKVERILYINHLGSNRTSAYPVYKAKAIAENWIRNSGVPFTIIQAATIYGPDDQFTYPIAKFLRSGPGIFLIPGKGESLLQPLSIDDFVNCLMQAIEDPNSINRTISVGGMETFSYIEIVRTIQQKLGTHQLLMQFSPAYLRILTLWIDQIFPKFPISIYWLDTLTEDRTTNLDSLPRQFGIMPARFKQNIEYLTILKKKRT